MRVVYAFSCDPTTDTFVNKLERYINSHALINESAELN